MSKLTDVIAEIDTETTRIAAQVEDIMTRLAAGDASAADQLQPLADRLKAIGSNPDAPVPPTPDTPPAP